MRALLLANMRSGSTFLVQSLDSHPDMWWDRAEPLLDGSWWRERYPGPRVKTMKAFYGAPARAKVAGMKMTYAHLDPDVWDYIGEQNFHLIHLTRKNVLRWAVSALVNQKHKGRPGHTDHANLPIATITVKPHALINLATQAELMQAGARREIDKLGLDHVLHLEYGEVVGGEGKVPEGPTPEATERVCAFLGVKAVPLSSPRRGVNRYPMSEIFTNWPEVREAIMKSRFRDLLEEERIWQ